MLLGAGVVALSAVSGLNGCGASCAELHLLLNQPRAGNVQKPHRGHLVWLGQLITKKSTSFLSFLSFSIQAQKLVDFSASLR